MGFFTGCGAVLVQDGKYVLVREVRGAKKGLYSLPGGTLELDEDLFECLAREVEEETGVSVEPERLVGVYQVVLADGNNVVFFVFEATIPTNVRFVSKEHDAIETFTYEEILALDKVGALRAPTVRASIEDFRAGRHYPLKVVQASKYEALASITVGKNGSLAKA